VRELIKLLYLLTVNVLLAGKPEYINQPRAVDLKRNQLACQSDIRKQIRKLSCRIGIFSFLVNNVAVSRDKFFIHIIFLIERAL
jgi:hypothetical protein